MPVGVICPGLHSVNASGYPNEASLCRAPWSRRRNGLCRALIHYDLSGKHTSQSTLFQEESKLARPWFYVLLFSFSVSPQKRFTLAVPACDDYMKGKKKKKKNGNITLTGRGVVTRCITITYPRWGPASPAQSPSFEICEESAPQLWAWSDA